MNARFPSLIRSIKKSLRFSFLGLFVMGFGLIGCMPSNTWDDHAPRRGYSSVATPDPVTMRLAEASERAAKALENMSLVEQARTPVDTTPPIFADAPEELRQLVTISWTGPVESVTALLADVAGYSFSTIGAPSSTPVVVTVEVTERPVIEVLRSIGLQMGRSAALSVNADKRVVEVRYVPVSSF